MLKLFRRLVKPVKVEVKESFGKGYYAGTVVSAYMRLKAEKKIAPIRKVWGR